MGWIENLGNDFRERRHQLTGGESVATLEHMEDHYQDGANWTQGMYENANGAKCLVAAANHVRVSCLDDAKHWLDLAIAEVAPGVARIEDFNDRSTYAEVAAVIARAKQLAAQSVARLALPAPPPVRALAAPVAEILPPQQPAPALSRATPVPVTRATVRSREPRSPRPSLMDWLMD